LVMTRQYNIRVEQEVEATDNYSGAVTAVSQDESSATPISNNTLVSTTRMGQRTNRKSQTYHPTSYRYFKLVPSLELWVVHLYLVRNLSIHDSTSHLEARG